MHWFLPVSLSEAENALADLVRARAHYGRFILLSLDLSSPPITNGILLFHVTAILSVDLNTIGSYVPVLESSACCLLSFRFLIL